MVSVDFIINLLAEFVFALGFINLMLYFPTYQKGKVSIWSKLGILFFVLSSPFYLLQKLIYAYFAIPVFVILIIVGTLITWRVVKYHGYRIAINEEIKQAKVERSIKDVFKLLNKSIQLVPVYFILPIIALAFFQGSGIMNIIVIASLIITALIFIYHYVNTYKTQDTANKLKVSLSTLFYLSLISSILLFLALFFTFYTFFLKNPIIAIVGAAFAVTIPLYMMSELIIIRLGIFSNEDKSLSQAVINSYKRFTIAIVILTVIFSDIPLVYSILNEENISQMIYWTTGFIVFIFTVTRNAIGRIERLKLESGLLSINGLENEINKIELINDGEMENIKFNMNEIKFAYLFWIPVITAIELIFFSSLQINLYMPDVILMVIFATLISGVFVEWSMFLIKRFLKYKQKGIGNNSTKKESFISSSKA